MDLQVLRRRIALATGAVITAAGITVACTGTNGDGVGSQIFDASPLDARRSSDPFEAGIDAPDPVDAAADTGRDASGGDAGTDAASPSVARINEVYADNAVDGDVAEYVEIAAPPGTPVSDLKLRIVHSDGTVKYEVALGSAGAQVGASGLWVVGGGQVFKVAAQNRVDNVVAITSWGLDNTRGVIQLVRGAQRELVDVVGYDRVADAGALGAVNPPPSASSEGSPAIAPTTTRKAFGRKVGFVDTGNNRVDFCEMDPTPGYPQSACR